MDTMGRVWAVRAQGRLMGGWLRIPSRLLLAQAQDYTAAHSVLLEYFRAVSVYGGKAYEIACAVPVPLFCRRIEHRDSCSSGLRLRGC